MSSLFWIPRDLTLVARERGVGRTDVRRDLVFEVGRVPGQQVARGVQQGLAAVEAAIRVVRAKLDEVLTVGLAGLDEVAPGVVGIGRQIGCSEELPAEGLVVGGKLCPLRERLVVRGRVERQERLGCSSGLGQDALLGLERRDLGADGVRPQCAARPWVSTSSCCVDALAGHGLRLEVSEVGGCTEGSRSAGRWSIHAGTWRAALSYPVPSAADRGVDLGRQRLEWRR